MKERIGWKLTLFLLVAVVFSIFQNSSRAFAAGEDGNGFVIQNGVLTDYKGHRKNIVVPEGVVRLKENAFNYNWGAYMYSIQLPESLEVIEEDVFNENNSLAYIKIPAAVTELSAESFSGCYQLKDIEVSEENKAFASVDGVLFNKDKTELIYYPAGRNNETYTVPKGVKKVSMYAFYGCDALKNVKLPKSLQTIGSRAFASCDSLQKMEIPSHVTEIYEGAFSSCDSLKEIHLSEDLETIDYDLFYKCISLEKINIPSKVKKIYGDAFYQCEKLSSVTLPESLEIIDERAFYGCTALKTMEFPEKLEKLEEWAFTGCSSLKTVAISSNVKNIGVGCFSDCNSLGDLTVSVNNAKYASVDSVLYNKDKTQLLLYPAGKKVKEYHVQENIEGIESHAFSGNMFLEKITLPENLAVIGNSAFSGCESLTEIHIPQTVSQLGKYTFENCKGLVSIVIPEGISVVSVSCFRGCGKLKSVTFSDNVKVIEEEAFYGCRSLSGIELPKEVEEIGLEAFSGIENLYISLPDSLKNINNFAFDGDNIKMFCHKGTTAQSYAQNYADRVDGSECVFVEGDLGEALWKAVKEKGEIQEDEQGFIITEDGVLTGYTGSGGDICIPEGVVKIGDGVFSEKDTIISVEIPGDVETIGYGAFENDENLEKVVIKEGTLGEIEMSAFAFCPKLKEVQFPSTLKILGKGAFQECSSLKEIRLPSGLERLTGEAFLNCPIEAITIPENVSSIDYNVFEGCENLKEINVAESNTSYTSVDGILFNKDKTRLCIYPAGKTGSEYIIPDGVVSVGTFIKNKYLVSVKMPDSVTTVSDSTFEGCENLENVILSKNIEEISPYMFYQCHMLKEIIFPEKINSIGNDAFYECKSLKSVEIPEGIKAIHMVVFCGCSSLETVKIPRSVTAIEWQALNNCHNLNAIAVEADNISRIDNEIISLVDDDFKIYCHADSSFLSYAKQEFLPYQIVEGNTWDAMDADLKNQKEKFIVKDGVLTEYNGNGGYVEIPYGVKKIGDSVFAGNDTVFYVSVPDSVAEIGTRAFQGCRNLVGVNLSDSLSAIGDYAFHSCQKLTGIVLPSDITEVGENAFGNCSRMSEITVSVRSDNKEKTAEVHMLSVNTGKNYVSEDGVLYTSDFSELVQYPAGKREEIYAVKNTVTTLSFGCFDGCRYLSKVAISDNVKTIENSIFTPESRKCEIYCHKNAAIKNYAEKNQLLTVLVDEDKNVAEEMEKDWEKGQVTIGDADGNGQINSGDALIILKIAAQILTPSEEQEKSADVNGDGRIDAGDALKVLKYAAKLITEF